MKTIRLLLFALLALTLFGCAGGLASPSTQTDMLRTYATVFPPGGAVSIHTVQAYQQGDELRVSGRIKRNHKLQLPGHLDLAIITPEGIVLSREKIRILGLASNRKGVLELPFRMHLDLAPPAGSAIHLRYHAPAEPGADCS